jgi:hypothetical protein
MQRKAQINVIYMSYFILLGLIFLGFVFTLSNDFKKESIENIREDIADSILTRIEKNAIELRTINNQTQKIILIKTMSVPKLIGQNSYQIIGNGIDVIISSPGEFSLYKTKTIIWKEIQFEGASDSQNSEITLLYNTTSNKIRIS